MFKKNPFFNVFFFQKKDVNLLMSSLNSLKTFIPHSSFLHSSFLVLVTSVEKVIRHSLSAILNVVTSVHVLETRRPYWGLLGLLIWNTKKNESLVRNGK